MSEILLAQLEKYNHFLSEKKILIALSGGADSMALLFVAKEFCQNHNSDLFSLTINHNLRDNSASEAKELHKIMKEYDVNHKVLSWQEGKEIETNIEAKAREGRYQILLDYAVENNINVILTAHHFDDQIENFFIRLSRGSGIDGLANISAVKKLDNNITLIRPFLNIKKSVLNDFIEKNKIIYFVDETNDDQKFLRNKIRKLLKEIIDDDLTEKRISVSMSHFSRAKDFFTQYVAEKYQKLVKENEKKELFLSLDEFKKLHSEIALRLLVYIFNKINDNHYKPRFEKLWVLYQNIINNKINKRVSFSHSIIAIKQNRIIFIKEFLSRKNEK